MPLKTKGASIANLCFGGGVELASYGEGREKGAAVVVGRRHSAGATRLRETAMSILAALSMLPLQKLKVGGSPFSGMPMWSMA